MSAVPRYITLSDGLAPLLVGYTDSTTGVFTPAKLTLISANNPSGTPVTLATDSAGNLAVRDAATGAAVSATGAAAPASAFQVALPNSAGNLTSPVLASDGGIPGHITNFPATLGPASIGNDVSANANSLAGLTALFSFTVSNAGQYRVWNNSAATVYVVYGSSGNQTIVALAPALAAGQQGADTSPELPWFVGTITVYGAAGSNVAARHN